MVFIHHVSIKKHPLSFLVITSVNIDRFENFLLIDSQELWVANRYFHLILTMLVHYLTSTTTTFCDPLDFVRDYPGEPVLEETFTRSHLLCSSIIPYLLPPSITIHGILPIQFTCLTVYLPNFTCKFSLVCLLAWHTPLHTPNISSPVIVFFLQHMLIPSQPVLL